jgi:hypothetical protein
MTFTLFTLPPSLPPFLSCLLFFFSVLRQCTYSTLVTLAVLAVLELTETHLPLPSPVLGLKACTTTPQPLIFILVIETIVIVESAFINNDIILTLWLVKITLIPTYQS